MNKQIIINVDDFGLTPGVNQAVFELNQIGVVKSTTAIVNSPYFECDIQKAIERPTLGVGLHLTIDLFKAEIYHPSLCDDDNNFHQAQTHDLNRSLDSEVVYQEWKAQVEKFIKITGIKPTHLDSHHHAHILNHDANIAITMLANEYQLPVRQFQTSDYKSCCTSDFYDQGVTLQNLCAQIKELLATDNNYLEIMAHPAIVDQQLLDVTSYNTLREVEYEILASKEFELYLNENEIAICNYADKR